MTQYISWPRRSTDDRTTKVIINGQVSFNFAIRINASSLLAWSIQTSTTRWSVRRQKDRVSWFLSLLSYLYHLDCWLQDDHYDAARLMMKTVGEFSFLSFQLICLSFSSIKSTQSCCLNAQDEQVSEFFTSEQIDFALGWSTEDHHQPTNIFLISDGSHQWEAMTTNVNLRFTSEPTYVSHKSLVLDHRRPFNRSTNSIINRLVDRGGPLSLI